MKKLRHLLLQTLIALASFAVTTTVILLAASGIKRIFGHDQVYPGDISIEVKGCDVGDSSPSTAADNDTSSESSHDQPEDSPTLLPLGSVLYPEDYSDTHPYVTSNPFHPSTSLSFISFVFLRIICVYHKYNLLTSFPNSAKIISYRKEVPHGQICYKLKYR